MNAGDDEHKAFVARAHADARGQHDRPPTAYDLAHIATLSAYVLNPRGEYVEVYFPEWDHLLRDAKTFASQMWTSPAQARRYMAERYPHLREVK
jgi:hypothetical protein